jgi:hypothetical protein
MEPRKTESWSADAVGRAEGETDRTDSARFGGLHVVEDPEHASISLCTRIGRSSVRPSGDGWVVRAVNLRE